jgi:undecaprenyl-diphosphatase
MQGPAELLPVSSSGHLALVPALLGWEYSRLSPQVRKSFEVALHAGSAPALALCGGLRPRRVGALAAATLPAAAAGLLLERRIEERAGGVRAVALAQIGAGAALWLADRSGADRGEPDALDHAAVGLAQAVALVPGVSRAGAALTAARLRGLARPAAVRLSLEAGLPVTVAAAVLKAARAARSGVPPELRRPMAAGAATALLSTVVATSALGRLERAASYAPLATYRVALGCVALAADRWRNRPLAHTVEARRGTARSPRQ